MSWKREVGCDMNVGWVSRDLVLVYYPVVGFVSILLLRVVEGGSGAHRVGNSIHRNVLYFSIYLTGTYGLFFSFCSLQHPTKLSYLFCSK
jgi:hypothetical protein